MGNEVHQQGIWDGVNVSLYGEELEEVDFLRYLGSIVAMDGEVKTG